MGNAVLEKRAGGDAVVTRADLKDWLGSSAGNQAMSNRSNGELLTYALGAGVGGLGAYGLYHLMTKKRNKGHALLLSLLGAGAGLGGAHMLLNSTDPSTRLSMKDRLRISAAYNTNPAFKKLYDRIREDKKDSALGAAASATGGFIRRHPILTGSIAGGAGGAGVGAYRGGLKADKITDAWTFPSGTGGTSKLDRLIVRADRIGTKATEIKPWWKRIFDLDQYPAALKRERITTGPDPAKIIYTSEMNPTYLKLVKWRNILGHTAVGGLAGGAIGGAAYGIDSALND